MNKGKINLKTIIVIVILLLVGVLGVVGAGAVKTYLGSAAAGSDPKEVVATPSGDGKTATIAWSTDKAVQSVVLYGSSPAALLLSAAETDSGTSHSVGLKALKPGQNYYFRIEVGEETFDNGGIPWSFKTSGSAAPTAAPVTPTPTAAQLGGPAAGACDHTTDYNHDGVVNTVDFIVCMKGNVAAPKATPSTSSAGLTGSCDNVDYDHNGVINSLDRIKCLQNKK